MPKNKMPYYVALSDPIAGVAILGGGSTESAARDDAALNAPGREIYIVARVPGDLALRVERDGDAPGLAAECYARADEPRDSRVYYYGQKWWVESWIDEKAGPYDTEDEAMEALEAR